MKLETEDLMLGFPICVILLMTWIGFDRYNQGLLLAALFAAICLLLFIVKFMPSDQSKEETQPELNEVKQEVLGQSDNPERIEGETPAEQPQIEAEPIPLQPEPTQEPVPELEPQTEQFPEEPLLTEIIPEPIQVQEPKPTKHRRKRRHKRKAKPKAAPIPEPVEEPQPMAMELPDNPIQDEMPQMQ